MVRRMKPEQQGKSRGMRGCSDGKGLGDWYFKNISEQQGLVIRTSAIPGVAALYHWSAHTFHA